VNTFGANLQRAKEGTYTHEDDVCPGSEKSGGKEKKRIGVWKRAVEKWPTKGVGPERNQLSNNTEKKEKKIPRKPTRGGGEGGQASPANAKNDRQKANGDENYFGPTEGNRHPHRDGDGG